MRKVLLLCGMVVALGLAACGADMEEVAVDSAGSSSVTESGTAGTATAQPSAEPTAEPTTEPTPEPMVLVKVQQETHYGKDGNITFAYSYEYDEAGNRIKRTCLDTDGSVKYWHVYEYDAAGNQTAQTYYDKDGTPGARQETVYNEAGVKIQYTSYKADGSVAEHYVYNDAGDMVERVTGGKGSDTADECYVYIYNDAGKLIKEEHFVQGQPYGWEDYTYDEAGSRTSYFYAGDNSYSGGDLEEYDASGRVVKRTNIKSNGEKSGWETYQYNDNGKLVYHGTYSEGGECTGYSTYEYDTSGRQIKETEYRGNGEALVWIVNEYDEKGALIKNVQEDMMGMKMHFVNCRYVYNEAGRVVEKIDYSNSGNEVMNRVVYEYTEIVVEQ